MHLKLLGAEALFQTNFFKKDTATDKKAAKLTDPNKCSYIDYIE